MTYWSDFGGTILVHLAPIPGVSRRMYFACQEILSKPTLRDASLTSHGTSLVIAGRLRRFQTFPCAKHPFVFFDWGIAAH